MPGPFYFAWIESGADPAFGPEHHVEDEQIASFHFKHAEGRFATLDITVVNPRTGPLAPGRKQWAWFSKALPGSDGEVVPIGLFRLVAMPTNMLGNLVTFSFHAEPVDYQEQKNDLADSLRVLPYYDKLFVSAGAQDDADAVLEAYSASFYIDPITHEVSISDVLVGEDGTVTFDGDDAFYDGVDLTVDRPPVNAVTIKAAVPWTQSSAAQTFTFPRRAFSTANGKGIVDGWPKAGDELAGGYRVVAAQAIASGDDGDPFTGTISYTNEAKRHIDGDLLSLSESFSAPTGIDPVRGGVTISYEAKSVAADRQTGTPKSDSINRNAIILLNSIVSTSLVLGVSATNDRQDMIEFKMVSDVQPVFRDPENEGDETGETIDVSANDASEGAPAGDTDFDSDTEEEAPPIGDPGRGEYITTDRGMESVVNLLLRGRARLRIGSRVANAKWRCRFDDAMGLSLRKNALLEDPRIPGGQAVGKITEYTLEGDGGTGSFVGTVNIGCSVGKGTAITTSDGEPDYVEEDYVDPLYQTYTGIITAVDTGDVGYGLPYLVATAGNGITFPLDRSQIVIRDEVMDKITLEDWSKQLKMVQGPFNATTIAEAYHEYTRLIMQAFADRQTWREIELVDLTDRGATATWALDVTPLVLPRQVDFEAV